MPTTDRMDERPERPIQVSNVFLGRGGRRGGNEGGCGLRFLKKARDSRRILRTIALPESLI